MSTSKSFQNQQGFTSYRPHSPKLTSNSPTSNNTNQNHSYIPAQARGKHSTNAQIDHFASIRHENNLLKQENKALKRQINIMKGQFYISQPTTSGQEKGTHEVNDLRQTIKKQAGEIKQLKTRLQLVSKQSKMYEQIIAKMQGKINKLTEQNRHLQQKLKQCKFVDRHEKQEKQEDRYSKQKIVQLTQKINEVMAMYSELQCQVNLNDKQWQLWKDQWGKQKSYYLNRIHDLEGMMGIGVENKDFHKKRF